MGRRDGKVSLASNVDLPAPTISVAQSIAAFQKKGLTVSDMVLLLGNRNSALSFLNLEYFVVTDFVSSSMLGYRRSHGRNCALLVLL